MKKEKKKEKKKKQDKNVILVPKDIFLKMKEDHNKRKKK